MRNDELEKILSSASVPERDETYWKEFPEKIQRGIQQRRTMRENDSVQRRLSPAFIIGLGFACLVCAFVIGFWKDQTSATSTDQMAIAQKYFREVEAMFPNQIKAIVLSEEGFKLVLSENPDVPRSTPLLLSIANGKTATRILTFSGQQITIHGERYEVLLNSDGQVLLVGENSIWTSSDAGKQPSKRIKATPLERL